MGIDYSGVGGVGVEFSDGIREGYIKNKIFTEEMWDNDKYDCLELTGVGYGEGGNAYSGDITWYLFVDGGNLGDINSNAKCFTEKIHAMSGVLIKADDLLIISDICIY